MAAVTAGFTKLPIRVIEKGAGTRGGKPLGGTVDSEANHVYECADHVALPSQDAPSAATRRRAQAAPDRRRACSVRMESGPRRNG
jgi:hypothetical protein